MKQAWIRRGAGALCLAGTFSGAFAAPYPERPVRLVVPFAAGGNTDIFARAIGQRLSELWGQQVVVDNRGGAGGTIGTGIVAKAAPDGYTLLMVSGSHVVNPSLKKLPYDTLKDFTAVSLVVDVPSLLVAHPSVPAKTIPQLISLAKASPRKLNYGSSGTGTFAHLSFELFKSMAGVQIQHIPYKGNAPATADLLGGQVQLMMGAQPTAMPHVRSQKLVPLGVTSEKRSAQLPDVPAIAEFLPGYEFNQGFGVLGPAGMPAPVVQTVHQKLVQVLDSPDVRDLFASQGAFPVGNTPSEYSSYVKREIEKMAKIVKESGARVE